MDTGVDGKHPDIAPNFDRFLSRNFTIDNSEPGIDDGPCEHPSCVDPADEDDDGHGTHVASTIGSPLNGTRHGRRRPEGRHRQHPRRPGLGLLPAPAHRRRAHLRRSGRHRRGQHVVLHRPVAVQLREQPGRLARAAGAAAHDHRGHAARGELRAPPRGDADRGGGQRVDGPRQSDVRRHEPGLPAGRGARAHDRQRLPELPSEAPHVLDVSVGGPGQPRVSPYPRKAFYSNYGVEQTVVAAPGGDSREFFGTPQYNAPENRILAAYPLNVAQACGEVDANGVPNGATTATRSTRATASPLPAAGAQLRQRRVRAVPVDPGHVDGLPARGRRRGAHRRGEGQARLVPRRPDADPGQGRAGPASHGDRHAVPGPGAVRRTRPTPGFDATCVGTPAFNGFYGDGIVNALAASKSGGGGRR